MQPETSESDDTESYFGVCVDVKHGGKQVDWINALSSYFNMSVLHFNNIKAAHMKE